MLENLRRKSLTKTYHDLIHQIHFESGLAKYGSSAEIDVCTQRLSKKLQKSSFETQINKFYRLDIETYIYFTLNMIYCPKGTFMMGLREQDASKPQRIETIERPFLLGETEITQELYVNIMKGNPSQFPLSPQHPVERVSWEDAIKFCNKLSKLQGLDECYTKKSNSLDFGWHCDFTKNGYRLPEEKEWEYAAKASTNNRWSGTDDESDLKEYAWFGEDRFKDGSTHPVKMKKPNEWGFYDMTGNVDEWCWDTPPPPIPGSTAFLSHRATRGGSRIDAISSLRVAYHRSQSLDNKFPSLGFRICRSIVA